MRIGQSTALSQTNIPLSQRRVSIIAPPHSRRVSAMSSSNTNDAKKPILLFDIMDTVVKDPFYSHMAPFFDMTFEEVLVFSFDTYRLVCNSPLMIYNKKDNKIMQLLAHKHPTAWVEFEKGEINEDKLFEIFFKDGRRINGPGLVQHMIDAYTYIEGMDEMLEKLNNTGYELHACSNYPVWHKNIENKLALSSRGLQWTFISCQGPMQGLRKPQSECYQAIVDHLGVDPDQLVLIDDRKANIDGAKSAGMKGIVFKSAQQLAEELQQHGVTL